MSFRYRIETEILTSRPSTKPHAAASNGRKLLAAIRLADNDSAAERVQDQRSVAHTERLLKEVVIRPDIRTDRVVDSHTDTDRYSRR